MELRQLEYFLTVSDLASFTRAAERLYVSQPAVTNAVRSLEDELGVQLLDRSQRTITLTEEGKIFYRHIQNVMHGISTTLNEINDLKSHNRGHLLIGITPLGGISSTAHVLARFRTAYPNINLTFIENNVNELENLVREDKLDFAFVYSTPGHDLPGLRCIPLEQEELMVCCSHHHQLARMNSVTPDALSEESLLLMEENCSFRRILITYFEEADNMPPITMELPQVSLLTSLIAVDIGISILPECLIEHDRELSAVPLSPPLFLYPAVIYRADKLLSHAAQAFVEALQKEGSTS